EFDREGNMDDAVRGRGTMVKAPEVVEAATMNLGSGCLQRCRGFIGASEANNSMARRKQFANDRRADVSSCSGDEHFHATSPFIHGLRNMRLWVDNGGPDQSSSLKYDPSR